MCFRTKTTFLMHSEPVCCPIERLARGANRVQQACAPKVPIFSKIALPSAAGDGPPHSPTAKDAKMYLLQPLIHYISPSPIPICSFPTPPTPPDKEEEPSPQPSCVLRPPA